MSGVAARSTRRGSQGRIPRPALSAPQREDAVALDGAPPGRSAWTAFGGFDPHGRPAAP